MANQNIPVHLVEKPQQKQNNIKKTKTVVIKISVILYCYD